MLSFQEMKALLTELNLSDEEIEDARVVAALLATVIADTVRSRLSALQVRPAEYEKTIE
jgi:hypothetical protein